MPARRLLLRLFLLLLLPGLSANTASSSRHCRIDSNAVNLLCATSRHSLNRRRDVLYRRLNWTAVNFISLTGRQGRRRLERAAEIERLRHPPGTENGGEIEKRRHVFFFFPPLNKRHKTRRIPQHMEEFRLGGVQSGLAVLCHMVSLIAVFQCREVQQ